MICFEGEGGEAGRQEGGGGFSGRARAVSKRGGGRRPRVAASSRSADSRARRSSTTPCDFGACTGRCKASELRRNPAGTCCVQLPTPAVAAATPHLVGGGAQVVGAHGHRAASGAHSRHLRAPRRSGGTRQRNEGQRRVLRGPAGGRWGRARPCVGWRAAAARRAHSGCCRPHRCRAPLPQAGMGVLEPPPAAPGARASRWVWGAAWGPAAAPGPPVTAPRARAPGFGAHPRLHGGAGRHGRARKAALLHAGLHDWPLRVLWGSARASRSGQGAEGVARARFGAMNVGWRVADMAAEGSQTGPVCAHGSPGGQR